MSENIIKKLNVNGVEYSISSTDNGKSWKDIILEQLGLNINVPDMPGYVSVIKYMNAPSYNGQSVSASGQSSYSDQKPYYVFNKSNGSWTGQDSAPGTSCYLQISGIDPSLYPEIGTIEYNTTQKTIPFVIQGFTGSEWVDLSEQKSCSPGSNRIDFIIDQSYKI